MLEAALSALAMTGATTIVAAMATDAWQNTRAGTHRMFRRAGATEAEGATLLTLLDADAALVDGAAADEDAGAVRADLAPSWNRRLTALLRDHPEAVADLRELLASAPGAGNTTSWVQNVKVSGHGHAYPVQGGNIVIHNTGPESEPEAPAQTPADGEREGRSS
ncbi:hypothetical protein [Streptomyces virginiae]|uniref:hypothetical protein n=1 Tax=Streptomyces virginiae TaxID=1961 RepID=UPI002E2A9378|nr:hypothetical protein [Streptomyces virginiae]